MSGSYTSPATSAHAGNPQTPVASLIAAQKVYQRSAQSPRVYALRGVDMTIQRGQYVAIMGPSGSGKSTMMNILGCLDRPTSGQYLLEGQNVADLNDEQLSHTRGRRLGFVFQTFNLISQLTVVENVEVPLFYRGVPRHERRDLAMAVIARMQLDERVDHRPAQLSGGQQQRVAIARALINSPSLLLADEPTGNLDSVTGEAILELFDELHDEGMTIVMVTHDQLVAQRCQRVVRMRDGLIDDDQFT